MLFKLCKNFDQTKHLGSTQLRPFVEALVNFFKDAFNQTRGGGHEVPVLNNAKVRTEFALLFYDQNEF